MASDITLDLNNPYELNIPESIQIKDWLLKISSQLDIKKMSVSFYITTPMEIQEINLKYRKKNKPTNVLSFPYENIIQFNDEEIDCFIGDIILCPNIIEQESIEQNKKLIDHWAHITIHGILHLLGYDHIICSDAEQMERLEIEILESLHIENPYREEQ